MKVELVAITGYLQGEGSSEALLEHAGRICYRSEARGDPAKFLQARLREGHESIVEHASATYEISGISRACSHQLVRHRLASYSQESQRYVDMADPEWVLPPSISGPRVVIPMTPPHVRLPISGPSPALLKRAGKMSPSEAEFPLIRHTMWPWKTSIG